MTSPSTVVNAVRTAVVTPLEMAGRASAGPVLVRLIAVVAAVGAAMLAAPPALLGAQLPSFVIVAGTAAVLVGLFPRTRWVGTFLLGVVGLWLVATIGYGVGTDLARVGGLAACLYLTHSAASIAAVLPYDAVVPGRVLRRWAGRVATVLVAGLGVGVGGMALVGLLTQIPSAVGPIVGSVVAAMLVGVTAWQLRRRP
jgi:hypothetical protein